MRAEVYRRNIEGRVYPGRVVGVERVMGHKTLFNRAASGRKGLHVHQVVVQMGEDFVARVGLQAGVRPGRAGATARAVSGRGRTG
ncbi:MAG: hypothetical protein C0501_11220 [Isosphaera sp.]|nr:hypothetical protein [Isosphaera sp.]